MPRSEFRQDEGWAWMVLLAGFGCSIMFDGIIFSAGIFYIEWLDFFREGHSRTAWIASLIGAVYTLIGPVASIAANKFGCRAVTMAGSVIASAGFILCTFSPNVTCMIITYGVMGGIGFGFMFLCSYVMVGHYFKKHLALATGLVSCGSGVGTFIFAPLSNILIRNFGWKGSMWIVSGLVLNGIVMGAIFRPVPVPVLADSEEKVKEKPKLLSLSLLKQPVFALFCFSSFLVCIGYFVPFMYLPDLARQLDISLDQTAALLSVIGITNTLGRIACGYVADKPWANPLKIYVAALVTGGLATTGCTWLNSYPLLLIYAGIFGFCIASYIALCAVILVRFFGSENLSNTFGFLNLFRGFAIILGAPLAGFLYDMTGSYHVAFYVAGASIAAAGLVCAPLRLLQDCQSAGAAPVPQHDMDTDTDPPSDIEQTRTLSVT